MLRFIMSTYDMQYYNCVTDQTFTTLYTVCMMAPLDICIRKIPIIQLSVQSDKNHRDSAALHTDEQEY